MSPITPERPPVVGNMTNRSNLDDPDALDAEQRWMRFFENVRSDQLLYWVGELIKNNFDAGYRMRLV
jgi:predicted PolB exonuclease-like 3'-5' exonuclease